MEAGITQEGTLLWEPSEEIRRTANIARYMNWLRESKDLAFDSYGSLWEWSVTDIEVFWHSLWQFFRLHSSAPVSRVLSERKMPGARWFQGAELNYAEHVFRNATPDRPALLFQSEIRPLQEISWEDLYRKVSSVAAAMRRMGVRPGDRVVAYLPNIPETVTAFLACAAIGAIWSSCSPDFGTRSVKDRFHQIEPKVLFAVDGYSYGGKRFDCRPAVAEIRSGLPTLEQTILVPYLWPGPEMRKTDGMVLWQDLLEGSSALTFEQLPFDHPLWIVYSSGTTGLPKGLVHGHGGILLEFMKFLGLQVDLKPGDRFFWFSTTGWVMWNILQGGLLVGATPVLYDGSPGYPDLDVLWEMAEKAGIHTFGTSAAFLTACMNSGMRPGLKHTLQTIRTVGSTGSPLSPEGFRWVYDHVGQDILLGSVSGGTDPCTAFLGCCPLLPVRAGELQCSCLGVRAQAFDENGNALTGEVGELVITEPMPSMPLYLWNDPGHKRYLESYFDMYPGVWRHGDWVRMNRRGSAVILGRSDSTLKRMGVRMGSSEIYAAVEDLPEVEDSLVVGFTPPGGEYVMPLFVVLKPGVLLDDALEEKIRSKIRTSLSPRHVPETIQVVPEVPRTLNGKKLEVPVKRILSGTPVEKAVNRDSMANPHSIDIFLDMAAQMAGPKKGE